MAGITIKTECIECGIVATKELNPNDYTDNELQLHARYCDKCLDRIAGEFLGDVLGAIQNQCSGVV